VVGDTAQKKSTPSIGMERNCFRRACKDLDYQPRWGKEGGSKKKKKDLVDCLGDGEVA